MAWSRFPNTVSVTPVTQTVAAGELATIPALGSPVNRSVDFQLMTPGQAFRDFGLELLNPAKLYAPADDFEHYAQGTRVAFDGATYAVVNAMRREDGTGIYLSYTLAILERVV